MQSNNKTVIGSYDSRDEALDVVHNLKSAGYYYIWRSKCSQQYWGS